MMRALLALLLVTSPVFGQDADSVATTIAASPESPVLGQEITLTFDAPVQAVVFTYRPNSAIPTTDTVRVGGFTSIKWTPRQAGVIRVAVPDGPSRNLSVRFATLPMSGVIVLVLAGLILFGGAGYAMRKLLSGGMPKTRPEVRPDT